MERDEIRLECLKLRHRHDRQPAEIIVDAKILEEYIIQDEPKATDPKKVIKKSGNPDILS